MAQAPPPTGSRIQELGDRLIVHFRPRRSWGALTFLAFGAASAYATTSCAKKVLADWFDNSRIDGFYPLHCYQVASCCW